ncbi:hypothetical protein Tco_0743681 [Tanacetum coccineum]
MENLNIFYQDIGPSSSAGGHLTQEEAAKEAIAIRISRKFALLEEERPIIETMAYNDKYKKILDKVWKAKVELDRKIVKEEEEAVGVTTLIAKFLILDISIDRDSPIVVSHGFLRTIRAIVNTHERLFSTFDGFCHQNFHAARSNSMRNSESNSDDEEDYQIKRNKYGALIYGPKPAPYLNCNDPDERSLAIQTSIGTLITKARIPKKKKQQTMGTNDDEARSSRSKRSRHETVEEVLLPQVHHEFLLWEGCNRDAKSRIRVRKAESDEVIFTLVAWIRAFNINEPIYAELCHEFYSTFEFDEVCADDELQTKKIIKFRFGGCAHSLTLLEFARRLGMYQAVELEEDGFNVYFEGAWVIARWMKRKGARTQKESQICCGQFISKLARKCRVLSEDVVRSLSAPIYCRDLDTTTLRDLIKSDGKLILEDPQPGIPRFGIPRPLRASMQDLYDRMGRIEIRQEAIEWSTWLGYQGVFEHMARVYSVPMQGATTHLVVSRRHKLVL